MKEHLSKRFFWLMVAIAVVLAGGISLCIGLQQSVWFDEAYSVSLAEQSWGRIVHLTAEDVHPPVYYWLLKAWINMFGAGELALRSMSALFLGLSVAAAGLLLKKLFGAKTALLALPFVVLAPFLLRYGFEIRMYAFASLIGAVATYVLVTAVEATEKKRRSMLLLAYAFLVVLGVYTLYFMALVWAAHLAWLILRARSKQERGILLQAVIAYAGSFLLFLPWLPNVLRGASGNTISPVTHALDIDNLLGIVTYMFFYHPPWELGTLYALGIGIVLVATGYLAVLGYQSAPARQRRHLELLAAYFFVPILVLVVVTQLLPIYLERYIAHFAVAGYMSLGVLAALSLQRKNGWGHVAVGVLAVALFIGCGNLIRFGNYNFQRIHTPSVKQAAARLSDCKNGAIIFADGPQVAIELGYYIKDCPIYFFNETLTMIGGFTMLSGSPLRVADASELPKADEILHVYYNKPKNALPSLYLRESVTSQEKLSVAVYRRHS